MRRIFNYQDLLSGTDIYFAFNIEKFGFINGEKFNFVKHRIDKSPSVCLYITKNLFK